MTDSTIPLNLEPTTVAITTAETTNIAAPMTAKSLSTPTVDSDSEIDNPESDSDLVEEIEKLPDNPLACADLFTQHFRDLQEAATSVIATVQSISSLDSALSISEDMLLHILGCEISCGKITEDSIHAMAMAGLSVFTDEEKLHLILNLDLAIRLMQHEAAAIKKQLVSKDQTLKDTMAELNRDKEGLERARDMFVNERDLLNYDRTALAHDQAVLDQDIDRYSRYLNLGHTIKALEHVQQVQSELVAGNMQLAAAMADVVNGPSAMMAMVQETNAVMKIVAEDTKILAESSEHLKSVRQAQEVEMEKAHKAELQKLRAENEKIQKKLEAATQTLANAEVRCSWCVIL